MTVYSLLVAVTLVAGGSGPRAAPARCPSRPRTRSAARSLARKWYRRAVQLYKQGRVREAHDAFVCTQSLLPAGLTAYWVGRTAQELGRWEEAKRVLSQLLDHPPEPVTREELKRRLEEIDAALAARRRRQVPREAVAVRKPRAAGAPGPRTARYRAVFWALVGVSGAMLTTALVTGGLALADQRALENAEDGTWWSPGLQARYDRRTPLLVTTWVSLGVGLLSATAATALFLLDRARPRERLSPRLSWRF